MIANGQPAEASDISAILPPGTVLPYAGSSAPAGYLLCDGSAVSRTTYAALFAVISTTFGVGDGSTTFNLPDLRGSIPVGAGTKSYIKSASISSVDVGSNIITTSAPHGFANGDAISLSGGSVLPRSIDTSQSSGSVSVDGSGNISIGGLPLPSVGDVIQVTSQSSTNFSAGGIYYVISASGSTFQVSGSPGGGTAGSGNSGSLVWSPSNTLDNLNGNSYYVARLSPTTLALGTNLANALRGIYQDITMAGTGGSLATSSLYLASRTLGDRGGEESHYLSVPELATHNHLLYHVNHTSGSLSPVNSYASADGAQFDDGKISDTGGNVPHENMPPFLVLNYIIRHLTYS